MVYTQAEITAALVSGVKTWAFRFERIAPDGTVLSDSETVESCKVSNNDLADKVKRTCTVTLSPDTTFDFLAHSLRPYARLKMLDGGYQEWCLGTFYLTAPTRAPDAPREPIAATGFDWMLKAATASDAGRVSTGGGAWGTYGALLRTLLANAGYTTTTNIHGDAFAALLPTATPFEWEPGTPYLTMIADLLTGLNFRSMYVDAFGVPQLLPYEDPMVATPLWTYTRDSSSVTIVSSTTIELDTFDTPNQWVGTYSAPEAAPLGPVILTNVDASSPYSTVSRGRTITRVLTSEEVGLPPDLTALTATVQRFKDEASQAVEQVTFDTGMMPFHGSGDALDVDAGSGAKRYREQTWELDLQAGGVMRHTARRTVTL